MHLGKALGHILISSQCDFPRGYSKYSLQPEKINKDGEDMLLDLSPIPEFFVSYFQMSYLLGVNQRTNPLDSTRRRCFHKELQNL